MAYDHELSRSLSQKLRYSDPANRRRDGFVCLADLVGRLHNPSPEAIDNVLRNSARHGRNRFEVFDHHATGRWVRARDKSGADPQLLALSPSECFEQEPPRMRPKAPPPQLAGHIEADMAAPQHRADLTAPALSAPPPQSQHRAEVAVSAPQLATPVPPPPPLPPQQLATATMSAPTPAPPPLPTQRAQSAPSDGAERLREENEQLRRENARYRAENEELRQRLTSMEVEVRSLRLEHRRDEAEAARAPAPP